MSKQRWSDFEQDLLDNDIVPSRIEPMKKKAAQQKNKQKQSFEANPDVQRWLQLESAAAADLEQANFNPTFLAGQRDADWILSSLSLFYKERLISDVLHTVKSGKEANVYCCSATSGMDTPYVAAKVYRPRMFRSLRNDAVYRQNRTQRDVDGQVVRDGSITRRRGSISSERGRATQVSAWIDYEYTTQQLLFNAGADIPRPLAHMGNALLMEYVGDLGEPAPLLREVRLETEEAQPLFEQLLQNIELFLAHNRVHGDLSEYNILYWDGSLKIIDFAQAIDPVRGMGVFPLFLRDIERVCSHFAGYGVEANAREIAQDIWQRQQHKL